MSKHSDLPPVVVDLDGTLVKTDFLYESFLLFIKQNPFNAFQALYWLIRENRAVMKTRIAQRVDIDVSLFPYHEGLIDWLKEQKRIGRRIVLATASHQKYAQAVADYLGLFDEVIATQDSDNLKGARKAEKLVQQYHEQGFDYAGDSTADLEVWRHARKAILMGGTPKFVRKVASITEIDQHFRRPSINHALIKALRPHQWLKNLLIFVPLFTSHSFAQGSLVLSACIAFVAFSLCASSIYIVNDFLDLQADRVHPRKRHRPFASGNLSITTGAALMLVCLLLAFSLSTLLSYQFLLVLVIYLFITTFYSLYIKHLLMLDVVTLGSLYTLRIIAGAVAISVSNSFWLLAFSLFLFLSLAMIKRVTELRNLLDLAGSNIKSARAYRVDDMPILTALGCASAYLSVLVMALYLNSSDVLKLYQSPQILWLVCPVLLYWVSRIWVLTHRGQVDDDPILFVVKDTNSLFTGLLVCLLFVLAV